VFTSLLEPFPTSIGQNDNQLVLLKDSHYIMSPYQTENQKTTIKLASNSVESYSKLSPVSLKGSSIVYGPYKNVQPFEVIDGSDRIIHTLRVRNRYHLPSPYPCL
jgi:oligosaccharyltransferase complex subunit alpha (ribophorin I)